MAYLAVLGSGVPQVVSRQCSAHLAQEACVLAEADPEGFITLCDFCLAKMQEQVSVRFGPARACSCLSFRG